MIYSYFKGTLTEKTQDYVVIECGGVGYVLQMGPGLSSKLPSVGEEAIVYAYLHFSQDRQQLLVSRTESLKDFSNFLSL